MELSKDILGGRKMEDRVLDWAVYEKTAREMAAEGLVLLKNATKLCHLSRERRFLYLDVCRTIIIRVEPVRAAW